MEEDINSPDEMDRAPYAMVAYLNRKRKFQDEQLVMPLAKHICSHGKFVCNSILNSTSVTKKVYAFCNNGEISGSADGDTSEQDSTKDSSTFFQNNDSIISISGESKTSEHSSDRQSTSSAGCGGNFSNNYLFSLESRSGSTKTESVYGSEEHDSTQHDSVFHPYLNIEEQLQEYGDLENCNCVEYVIESIERYKELEGVLHSNGVATDTYVLSSGRWTVPSDTPQQGTSKLTIDKEFEQYFSSLML